MTTRHAPDATIDRTGHAAARRAEGSEGIHTDTVASGPSAVRNAEGPRLPTGARSCLRRATARSSFRPDAKAMTAMPEGTFLHAARTTDTPDVPAARRPKGKIRAAIPAPCRVTGIARLDSRILVLGADECWPWRGYVDPQGYGKMRTGGKGTPQTTAHRLVHEAIHGPLPEILVVDHTCHNGSGCAGGNSCPHRRCCNPAHLEAVTQQVNVLRGEGPGGQYARRAECPNGHPFDQKTAEGDRRCGECTRIRRRERHALRRDEINALKRANKAKHRASRKAAAAAREAA